MDSDSKYGFCSAKHLLLSLPTSARMTYFDTISWKLLSLSDYHNYKEPSTKQEDSGASASSISPCLSQ